MPIKLQVTAARAQSRRARRRLCRLRSAPQWDHWLFISFAQQLCCLLNYRSFSVTSPHLPCPNSSTLLQPPRIDIIRALLVDCLGGWNGATPEHPLWGAGSSSLQIGERERGKGGGTGVFLSNCTVPPPGDRTSGRLRGGGKVQGKSCSPLRHVRAAKQNRRRGEQACGAAGTSAAGQERRARGGVGEGEGGGHFTLIRETSALSSEPPPRSVAP